MDEIGVGYMTDSRGPLRRWWDRLTTRHGGTDGEFVSRTYIRFDWRDICRMIIGRTVVVEMRSDVDPPTDDRTAEMLRTLRAEVSITRKEWT